MKKRISILLAAILVITMASVASAAKANVTLTGEDIKMDFKSYTIPTTWGDGFGAWSAAGTGNGIAEEPYSKHFETGDFGLKVTYAGAAEDESWKYNIAIPGDTEKAIGIHVHNTSSSDLRLRFVFGGSNNQYTQFTTGEKLYLIPDSGDAHELEVEANDSVTVPAGFKGKIVVPFASFKTFSSQWTSFDDIKEKETIGFQVKTVATPPAGAVVYYTNIAYYTDVQAQVVEEEEPPKTGDFGIALYVVAAAGAAGALVSLKRRNK